ncbi:hypothetical protein KYB31_06385 [Clostridium felsineum]|uniref:Alp7A family actin-like protein n=1 Tax=Clostridium felsineum TaxID=36839 RepID=UPI00098C0F60|nr:hypothetical protein [Clostridium felsineum]MCR3758623.1 hypothetical protein [Clostridium felsineum]URZ04556.1 hypothetical protein CLAUR_046450 [Clostridium felsineum]
MNIERFNADFGNSTGNFLIDGYYFEIPTNIVEISSKKAEGMFVSPITEKNELLDRLMISNGEKENEKFYLVGEFAQGHEIKTQVNQMNDKLTSIIPYANFLGAVAYYAILKNSTDDKKIDVEIDNMKMMLPIWLLKKASKFSVAQNEMAARFLGEHTVKVLTMGMERVINITVKHSVCKIESEVARYAIKYKMLQEDNSIKIVHRDDIVDKFTNCETILSDIGGGSIDCVKLGDSLTPPKERNSFKVIDIEPFLGFLETFRKEKVLQYFSSIKQIEKFLINNYKKQKYILDDPNSGKSYDFTSEFTEMLQDYADKLVPIIFDTFKETDRLLKFVYFGGEAPVLKPYIKKTLLKFVTEKVAEENHIFLDDLLSDDASEVFKPTSRTINLTALELLSLSEISTNKTSEKNE